MVDNAGVKQSQLCIVSLIGKSNLFEQQCNKSWKLNQLIKTPVFEENFFVENDEDFEFYYDRLNNTIYVHLRSFHDTFQLLHMINDIGEDSNIENFAQFWEQKQSNFIKKCLICFLLSHIVIISHSSQTFDLNYLRFFRTIEALRQKSKPVILDLFHSLNLFQDDDPILVDGRLCVPRVVFIFENQHQKGSESASTVEREDDQKMVNIARNLEEIIYNALHSSYIISNQTNSALFTIGYKQPFVFIHRCYKESSALGQTQKLLGILQGFVKQTKESSSNSNVLNRTNSHQNDDSFLFKRFLFRHIEQALTEGWTNDGVSAGSRTESSAFSLCTFGDWSKIFKSIRDLFESSTQNNNKILRQANSMVRGYIDPDGKLSETRCKKYLPLAVKFYEEALPARYTKLFHEKRLQTALEYFATYARGSSYKRYVQQLIDQCTRIWKEGRQLCEALSLTRNPCKNELHRLSTDDPKLEINGSTNLPVRSHNSKIQYIAASNCGQIIQEREDPFDLKEANYDFYQEVNKMVAMQPIYFEFPTFGGNLASTEIKACDQLRTERFKSTSSQDLSGASELSQSKSVALYSPIPTEDTTVIDEITGEKTSENQTVLCNDQEQLIPSVTEYLQTMNHSDSPPGLLPRYSSWSLCCIGRATDYIPTKGIQQPGFSTNWNFLVPWDINPHNNQQSASNAPAGGAAAQLQQRNTTGKSYKHSRRGATINPSIWDTTIRVYIGCEYECPRGHRFICSSPNHPVRAAPNGTVKDDGSKLVRSDMPLYTPCSCRVLPSGARLWSQLMRAFVVTPPTSCSIQCVLHPQVMPAGPNNPVFFPSYTQPIHLTNDSIWVLRFPFIYHDGEKPLHRPQNEDDLTQCLVLRDLFSWTNKS